MSESLSIPSATEPLILLVDDESGIRMLMEQIFAVQGYRTISAPSGDSALKILQDPSNPIDVVMLDLMMPGMSGQQLLLTRDTWADPSIRVLILSAAISASEKVNALEAGAVDFIEKPFKRAELLLRVDTHVRLRRYEQSLVAERNQLRTLIDNLPAHVYFKDAESRFVTANQAFATSLGLTSPDSLVGKTSQDLVSAEQAVRVSVDEAQALGQGIATVDRIDAETDAEGNTTWWQRSIVPLRGATGAISGLVGINRDVTRRLKTEAAVRANELQLRRILETVADAIIIVNGDGAISMINPAVESMFRYATDELLGRDVVNLLDPASRVRYEQLLADIDDAAVGTFAQQIELRGQRGDGSGFPTAVAVSDMLLGTQRFLIAVVRDITQQKRVEEELRRYSDTLEEMVAERTADLERAQLELLKQARLSQELELASQVQASLLAQDEPSLPGYGIAARALPARYVSGDFYDFVLEPEGPLRVVLGDIAGKGIAAALLTSTTRALLRREARESTSPAQMLAALNRAIYRELDDAEMFITLAVAALDPDSGLLTYASAGHMEILWFGRRTRECCFLDATGLPLGIEPTLTITDERIPVCPGDIVIFYSDGITEAMNRAGDLFGQERLANVVSAHHDGTAEAIAAAILQSLNAYSGHVAPEDDVTLVVLKAEARTIEREFDSSWATLDAVTALVRTSTSAYGSELTDRLELAASELVTNILKHAYKNERGKVNVSLALTYTHITLLLCDQGIHFNPDDIPEPSFGELVEGGYGLYIVRQLVEDTTYTREGDWNVWRLHVPVG